MIVEFIVNVSVAVITACVAILVAAATYSIIFG